ncbi:hypothetical protein DPEC_G00229580 [Dallia pectoralis]|uniref:Uncharacterized protein n=1 Tax=Dallia pectoralis TaxID=75939 RepID=A0ACC2G1Q0_DALPE|nr:hypothetical protein DPEC_G00229580 [Dallia pectoralis]
MTGLERLIFFGWLMQGTLCQGTVDKTNCTASGKPTVLVQASKPVLEGQEVSLTCNSSGIPPPHITWHIVRESGTSLWGSGKVLQITIMADVTKFYCEANNTCGSQTSEVTKLDVQYPPKTTSVSVNPSGHVMEGTDVTLSCSSNANPGVTSFTWYQVNGDQETKLGVKKVIRVRVSVDDNTFYCEAENKYGKRKSTLLKVDVRYPPKNTVASANPSGPVLEKSLVTLTCQSDAKPAVTNYLWYAADEGQNPTVNGSEQNLTVAGASGRTRYYCKVDNEHGSGRSTEIRLEVNYRPRNTSVSVVRSSSAESEGGLAVLTCSSDARPPASKYTWFRVREGVTESAGAGQNLTLYVADITDGGEYSCQAENGHGKDQSTPTNASIEFSPQIRSSSSCLRSKSQMTCTCESHGNPAPSVHWSLSGQPIKNALDTRIREEPLGKTGLRSTVTLRQSEEDTDTPLCLSVNSQGSASLQLCIASTGYQMLSFLIGVGAGAAGMLLLGVSMLLIASCTLRRMHSTTTWNLKTEDKTDLMLTDWTLPQEEDSLYTSTATPSRSQQPNGAKRTNGDANGPSQDHHGPPTNASNCHHTPLPHAHDLPPGDREVPDRKGE